MENTVLPPERGVVREVVWDEVFPWLLLLRAFRMATRIRSLVAAAAGILLTFGAWWAFARIFSGDEWLARHAGGLFGGGLSDPVAGVWSAVVVAFRPLFDPNASLGAFAMLFLALLAAAAIWAFFGGLITRFAAVQIARDERVGISKSLKFVTKRWTSYFSAPLLPFLAMLLPLIPLAIAGLLMRTEIGVLIVAIGWPILLVKGLVIAVLLFGLMFGWPLMWATISSQGTDSFDALSRTYSYVLQRPLRYLFYTAVATFLGFLAWFVVHLFFLLLVHVTLWGISWGTGDARLKEMQANSAPAIVDASPFGGSYVFDRWLVVEEPEVIVTEKIPPTPPPAPSRFARWGYQLISFWHACLGLLLVAFAVSYFWNAMTIIYMLLRRNVDGEEIDEVFLEAGAMGSDTDLAMTTTDPAGGH